MNNNYRRNSPRALRYVERKRREDEAPRLIDAVPDLVSLRLDIEDRSGIAEGSTHTRRVVVDRAPALFLVPCSEARCDAEEHDLTPAILRALKDHAATFHAEDTCTGSVGPSPCTRKLQVDAVASYRTAPPS
jgi:hypothetical protein